jgi:acetyl-CoA acetyltransferase
MSARGLRGQTAIAGIGGTPYYKRGQSPDPEEALCIKAICAAAADAGVHPGDIDGFVSYGGEHSSGTQLMAALGTRELRWSATVWGGGGGGIPGALGLAAAAIVAGQATRVAVYRAMAQGAGGRVNEAVTIEHLSPHYTRNGIRSAAQIMALRTQRLLAVDGVPASAMRALALASYYHAARNPEAYAYGNTVTEADYDASRWISEPVRLYDCSRENDAAFAVLLTAADEAASLRQLPAYLLSAPMGSEHGWGEIEESISPYTSAGFGPVARRLWSESGYRPADVDSAQIYTNFTGPAVAAIIEHGFCSAAEAGEFLTVKNLTAPDGELPVNTSGGDLAEGFVHGIGLVLEAVRQIRGTSSNQVSPSNLALITGGPASRLVSSALLGTAATL